VADETVAVNDALGRVTVGHVTAPHALPSFRRSTMDGYAVRAADTYGATDSLPAFLSVVGEVPMGRAASTELEKGQAALVHTGGMIPETADAVVQVELTQRMGDTSDFPYEIEVFKAMGVGQNVLQIGEDVEAGADILPAGHLLRPQDLGGLLALGITEIVVGRRPGVAILSTGDEVVAPDAELGPGQIRDINSYTVGGQTRQAGGIPRFRGIVPDDLDALRREAAKALEVSDMLVISAGSSVSARDMTVDVIDELGEPGVLLHGVATRPGKPTIVGVVDGKPVIGLPGNPVSAMIQFDMFGTPAVYRLQGLLQRPRRSTLWARLAQNLASESGREDYVPARLEEGEQGVVAVPVFGKSNLIYTLVNADGLIKIPLNKGGIRAGEWVEVRLF
ncbi:MAG TPA: gephyrin-like molybdotransferase Glp, partial [Candidatus Sulfomarinibacteraceae bacterium]|nr:gephyrin-like molybdotransferase Glp [Candidatus Sulfomarinibacteraceae bacterium]